MAEIIPLNTPLERYSLMAIALLVVIGCLLAGYKPAHEKAGLNNPHLQTAETSP